MTACGKNVWFDTSYMILAVSNKIQPTAWIHLLPPRNKHNFQFLQPSQQLFFPNKKKCAHVIMLFPSIWPNHGISPTRVFPQNCRGPISLLNADLLGDPWISHHPQGPMPGLTRSTCPRTFGSILILHLLTVDRPKTTTCGSRMIRHVFATGWQRFEDLSLLPAFY